MRILCLLLPNFPLRCEIQRRPDISHCSAVVLQPRESSGSQKLVLDHSPELAGLHRDMPLQQALSRYSEVELIQADLPYYWSIFNAILDSLEFKSPSRSGRDHSPPSLATTDGELCAHVTRWGNSKKTFARAYSSFTRDSFERIPS